MSIFLYRHSNFVSFAKSKISLPILLVFFTLFLLPSLSQSQLSVLLSQTPAIAEVPCQNFLIFSLCKSQLLAVIQHVRYELIRKIFVVYRIKNSGEHSNVSSLPDNPLTTKWENFSFCSKVSTICLIWITSNANPCPPSWLTKYPNAIEMQSLSLICVPLRIEIELRSYLQVYLP